MDVISKLASFVSVSERNGGELCPSYFRVSVSCMLKSRSVSKYTNWVITFFFLSVFSYLTLFPGKTDARLLTE